MGVPVLPLAVPGAAVSPGTSNWSLAKAAALTTMLLEVALVREPLVKLRVMVVGDVVGQIGERGDAADGRWR